MKTLDYETVKQMYGEALSYTSNVVPVNNDQYRLLLKNLLILIKKNENYESTIKEAIKYYLDNRPTFGVSLLMELIKE